MGHRRLLFLAILWPPAACTISTRPLLMAWVTTAQLLIILWEVEGIMEEPIARTGEWSLLLVQIVSIVLRFQHVTT
jgi:hypothetical protein